MSTPRRDNTADALRLGDRSAAVAEIRAALSALGLVDNPDADLSTGRHVALDFFDTDLDEAVRAFQQGRGLLVDGVVGEATYRSLKEASYRLGARTLNHQFGAPMYGDDVATLQARLQDLGFYTGMVYYRMRSSPTKFFNKMRPKSSASLLNWRDRVKLTWAREAKAG